MEEAGEREEFTLVTRKPYFGLPTACPICLPVYVYLKLARVPFRMDFNSSYPDSDQLPYVEYGAYVAYSNESGGVIDRLKKDGIVDLDSELHSLTDWLSLKAMISSWLLDALMYELWLGSDGSSAHSIYYSDISWPIGKILFLKQVHIVKQQLGITKENVERREDEIYKRASLAYGALSTRLGEQYYLHKNRPSSLDAMFLGHALFIIQALPENSVLRTKLFEHDNVMRYVEKFKIQFVEAGSSSSASQPHTIPSSSTPHRAGPNWSSKSKSKPKREKTEQEKTLNKRARYFLLAQLISVVLFISILGGYDGGEVEVDEDGDEVLGYE